ncbi:MAG: penicillin-binding protein 1A [Lautropia sp.]|nr:penicillin-binding protein 1A [Lautropia sp.]
MKADTPPPRSNVYRNDRDDRSAAKAHGAGTGFAADPAGRKPGGRRWTAGRIAAYLVAVPLGLAVIGVLTALLAVVLTADRLPSLAVLTDYRPKVPMHVYTADGLLIGEFGEERRSVVRIADFPQSMTQAILAAEDDRFYEHSGVDISGIARAAIANLRAGGRAQGASTITMQLARNFFLTRERSYVRKLYEVLLTWKIEQALTKDQILEIYANQIFLGQRSYGFGAAAETYFGKPLDQLNVAQMAMLAGLPKAPARDNPIVNPKRAKERQLYVLSRMHGLGYLDDKAHEAAKEEDIRVLPERRSLPLRADWASEMARQLTYEMFKDEAYSTGLNVYTTIVSKDQRAANAAVRRAVIDYDRKHGYRGPEAYMEMSSNAQVLEDRIEDTISQAGDMDDYLAAVVLKADPKTVTVTRGRGATFDIAGDGLKFVARWLNPKAASDRQIRPGAIVRIADGPQGWEIVQSPDVEAAFVGLNTEDGAVRAMVGGFDYNRSKFNRVTQSIRQPGSAFKPFIYSAALEKGFMASTLINDAPIILDPATTGGQLWEPKNYDGKYEGPLSLRTALARSKNMVSIRLLQSIGVDYAQDYITRFGFQPEKNPAYLTMALGAGNITPWQLASGISIFANGGYRVQPYLIEKITDSSGKVIAAAKPAVAGNEDERAIDGRNAFIMDSLLREVVKRGTATAAGRQLKRNDLAGKTGTTNDAHDAWFAGYATGIAGVAWMGFDQPRSLGERETGGGLALPMWINYMREVLPDSPEKPRSVPPGVIQVSGEYYLNETGPGQGIGSLGVTEDGLSTDPKSQSVRDQIF